MADLPTDETGDELPPTVTQTGEFDGPRRIAMATEAERPAITGRQGTAERTASSARHGTAERPAGTARHGTAERPAAVARHGTAERAAVGGRASHRHGTAERRAVGHRPSTRHGSGERPAVGERPARHGSGERPAVGDSKGDDFTIDARVPWEVGDLISGRYEIERPLGGGSMGDVFLGEDRLLKKPVALKVLRPDLAESRDTVRRFLREVALAHSVTHKNVVRIYDTGEEKGLPFFTMEVLQGQVLDDLLENPNSELQTMERMPIKKIRAIAFDVLDAMEAAHRAGVVHRDLKPGNVMLTHRGAIVMDFGVAGIDDMLERGKVPPSTSTLRSLVRTEVGTIFGSPAYMAPELWEGQSATVQSDLYAFGVMLYQMLTGRLPYSAKTPAAFVEKLSTAPPPPLRSLRRDVPWNLVRLVRRCMAREPEERPASATAAANLISPLRGQKRRRFVTGATIVSTVAAGALWMRTTPSWRDLGLPDALAEAELSAAVRAFDIGERAAALRRLDRLAARSPESAALAFWQATVRHDLGDPAGRLARCGATLTRGSASWMELAKAACEPTYRLAEPAKQTLEGGPRSIGPELLPLAVEWSLIPRLDADPRDDSLQALAARVLEGMEEDPDSRALWAMPVRRKLARRRLAAAIASEETREVRASTDDDDANSPLLLHAQALQALLDGDTTTASELAGRLHPIDPTMRLRIQMHDGRLDDAWTAIEALGAEDPHRAPLQVMWCGYALRFDLPIRPSRCAELPPGLTRALWDVHEGRPADVGGLDPGAASIVERFADIQAGKCGGGDTRPPRVRNVAAPFELFAAELKLTAALCPASPTVADPPRARSLYVKLATLSPNDPWLLMALARVDDAEGREPLAEHKRLAAAERWAGADSTLPMPVRLRDTLGVIVGKPTPPTPAVAGRGR